MAQGDWTNTTGLRPGIFNITVDFQGKINHVGVGYDVVLPSGDVAKQTGSNPTLDAATLTLLQTCVDAMWAGVMANEGVTITVPLNPPPKPPPPPPGPGPLPPPPPPKP
jgi:hypothetical protein